MAWTKLDDRFWSHPKIIALTDEAFRLYISSLNWSVSHLTDGVVPASVIPLLVARKRNQATSDLVACGLWDDLEDGNYAIHDFCDYQPTRDEVETRREGDRERKALHSDPSLREAIRKRDGNHCRYCGVLVNWRDRRSEKGGTYDHVLPIAQGGKTSLENVVVACFGCNASKGPRTPQEWGRELLEPIQTGSRSGSRSGPNGSKTPDPTRPQIDTPNGVSRTETQRDHDAVVAALIDVHGEPATEREWGKYHDTAKRLRDGQVTPDEYPRLVDAFRLKHGEGVSFGVATVSNRIGELRHHLLKAAKAREPVVVDPELCRHPVVGRVDDGVGICAACGTELEDDAP